MNQDPRDHGGIGDHGDDPHQPLAPGARERVHLEGSAEQLGPAVPGPAGVPAVVALHHLAGVGDVGHQAGQEFQRIHGLRAGGGPVGLVGAVGHLPGVRIAGHPLQRDRIAGTRAGQPQGEGAIVLGYPDAGMREGDTNSGSGGGGYRPRVVHHRQVRKLSP